MLGKLMAESGGAQRIATTLINVFGREKVKWAVCLTGFIVGIALFYEIGLDVYKRQYIGNPRFFYNIFLIIHNSPEKSVATTTLLERGYEKIRTVWDLSLIHI